MNVASRRSPQWVSYEIATADSEGEFTGRPYWDELLEHRPQAKQALQKMQRLEEAGFHGARTQWRHKGKKSTRVIVCVDSKKEPKIWLLKCTPHAWRLYFYVWESDGDERDKRLIYLYAFYKQGRSEGGAETTIARERCDCIGAGRCKTAQIEYPNW